MPPEPDDAAAMQFVAALGAAMAALPNYVQVGSSSSGGRLFTSHPDEDLRFDQTFPLATLIARAQAGTVTPAEGQAELTRIWGMPNRFPARVGVIGYTVQSAGLALILQPAPLTLLMAVVLGAMVGVMCELARHNDADWLHLADAELSSRQVVSGASRLVSGLMRMAQLAFGILVAAQVAGISDSHLSVAHVDRLGPWAPWLGILLYGLGAMLAFAYLGQLAGNAVLGTYAAGFGGGFALTVCALVVARRPGTPDAMSLILPGFWLLVPGSVGLISIALGVQSGLLAWRARRG